MIKDNVLYALPVPEPIPEISTGWFLFQKLSNYINYEKAFVDHVTGEFVSYKQLLQLSCGLTEYLRKNGFTSNDVIAIGSENNLHFFVVVLAGLFAGIPITTINPAYTETELKHVLDLTRPSIIFCSKICYKKFLNLKSKYPSVKNVIVTNGDKNVPSGSTLLGVLKSYDVFNMDLKKFSPTSLDSRTHLAFIMFSSGTTGLPKGVMITHHNVNARLMTQYNPKIWYISPNRYIIGVLPFFHAFGLQMSLGYIFDGKTIIVLDKFDPLIYLKSIEKYRIDTIIAVPTLLLFLGAHPLVSKYDLSSLRDIGYGSSPASPATLDAVTKRFGIRPRQGYGLTEATMSVSSVPYGTEKSESVGFLQPGMALYIRDPETGARLGPNGTGEICLKGDLIMAGYYRNEAANKETFTEDGFLRTGDIGYYDREEYLYIVDRMKELIKYKSFQVAPAELEAVLITHPKIKQVAVVGLPDEVAGELPLAFVVKEPNVDLTENEVKSYLGKFLSERKHLHGGVVFVDEIPVNSLGKILRREMRKLIPNLKSKL